MAKRARSKRACCLIAAIAIGTGAGAVFWFISAMQRGITGGVVARVNSDMRIYETAIRKYKAQNGACPAWSETSPPLTTPVSYLNTLIPDAFSPVRGASATLIRFASDENDYVIWSVGVDGTSQISGAADLAAGADAVISKMYDASNGALSGGDLVRTSLF